jgi:hypothetical protein
MYSKEYQESLEASKPVSRAVDPTPPCTTCQQQHVCEEMADTEPWAYSDQYMLCKSTGIAQYHDIDWWIIKACCCLQLTAEDLETISKKDV